MNREYRKGTQNKKQIKKIGLERVDYGSAGIVFQFSFFLILGILLRLQKCS